MSPTTYSLIPLAVFLTFACGRDSNKLPEPVRLEGVRILEDQIGIRDLAHVDSLLIGMVDDRFDKQLDEKRSYFYYHVNEGRVELIPLLNLNVDRPDLYGT